MSYENNRIAELKESIAKMQLELGYQESIVVIHDTLENTVVIPNDYLQETYGATKQMSKALFLDMGIMYTHTKTTEKEALKKINEAVKYAKEHYTESDMSWVKPLKEATKKYFAYMTAI